MDSILNNQTVTQLWSQIVDIWTNGYNGFDLQRIALALAILTFAVIFRRPLAALILRHVRFALSRAMSNADPVVDALAPPIRLVPLVLAVFIVTEFVFVHPRLKAFSIEVNRSLVTFTLFWALFRLMGPLTMGLNKRTDVLGSAMTGWVIRVGKIVALALGAAAILDIWGIKVGPILAGFGLVGAAVALGAQDVFKNLIAGMFIISERRFQNGDWIRADGVVEGTVETIGLRTTKVRRFDMAPVFVPNSDLSDNPVINFSQMTFRQISWLVGLEYSASTDQLRKIRDGIEAYISGNDDFAHPPAVPTFVRIDSFGNSAINMMVYCFTRSTVWGDWLRVKEALAYQIMQIVADADTGFAFPSQSIYVESMPKGTELFPVHVQSSAEPSDPKPQG